MEVRKEESRTERELRQEFPCMQGKPNLWGPPWLRGYPPPGGWLGSEPKEKRQMVLHPEPRWRIETERQTVLRAQQDFDFEKREWYLFFFTLSRGAVACIHTANVFWLF